MRDMKRKGNIFRTGRAAVMMSKNNMPKDEMSAVVIDRFGGPEMLLVKTVPVPEPKPDQILIRVESVGIGRWDIAEREGMIAQMYRMKPDFPWVLGSDKIVAYSELYIRYC